VHLGGGVELGELGDDVVDEADQRVWVVRVAEALVVVGRRRAGSGRRVAVLVRVRVRRLGHEVDAVDGGQRADDGDQRQQRRLGELELVDDGLVEGAALQHLAHVPDLVAGHVADVVADDVVHEVVLGVVVVVGPVGDEHLAGGGGRCARLGGDGGLGRGVGDGRVVDVRVAGQRSGCARVVLAGVLVAAVEREEVLGGVRPLEAALRAEDRVVVAVAEFVFHFGGGVRLRALVADVELGQQVAVQVLLAEEGGRGQRGRVAAVLVGNGGGDSGEAEEGYELLWGQRRWNERRYRPLIFFRITEGYKIPFYTTKTGCKVDNLN